jgi:hypothetical protein
MAAGLTKGHTWVNGERVSVANLHALIESGTLDVVTNAELNSGLRLINTSTPGSPITGDIKVGSDGALDLYYSGAFNDLPEDKLSLTLTNNSGLTAVVGDVVFTDPSDPAKFIFWNGAADTRGYNVAGVVGESSIGNGGSGIVYYRGVVSVKHRGPWASGDLLNHNGNFVNADYRASGSAASYDSSVFGIALNSGGSPLITSIATAFIWK